MFGSLDGQSFSRPEFQMPTSLHGATIFDPAGWYRVWDKEQMSPWGAGANTRMRGHNFWMGQVPEVLQGSYDRAQSFINGGGAGGKHGGGQGGGQGGQGGGANNAPVNWTPPGLLNRPYRNPWAIRNPWNNQQ